MRRFFIYLVFFCDVALAQPWSAVIPVTQGAASVMSNPAFMVTDSVASHRLEACLSHRSKLMMRELAESHAMLSFRIGKNDAIGLGCSYEGYDLFHTSRTALGYAKKLSKEVAIATRMELHSIRQGDGYGNGHAFTSALGAQWQMSDQLMAGFAIHNPNRSPMRDLRTPMWFGASLHWRVGRQATILLGAEKNDIDKPNYVLQADYDPSNRLSIRLGVSSGFEPISLAFGFRLASMELIAHSSYHEVFGFSPGATIRLFK